MSTARGTVLAITLALASMAGCEVHWRARVVVDSAPPAPRAEAPPARPGWLWVAGHWAMVENQWRWVPGHFVRERGPAYVWRDGEWIRRGPRYYWVDGHWETRDPQ